ncbi:MAG TPA: universal stress protein [Candidatus Binatia bacterium]|jgi:hypothetical protein
MPGFAKGPRSGPRHWFFGSVTDQLTRLSPCAVLSIVDPLPSKPWRGKVIQEFFNWTRPKTASL